MMVELVCLALPYARFPFERALQGIAAAGYRYVGFGLTHEDQLVPSELADDVELAALRRQAEGHGLAVRVLHGPRGRAESRVDQYRRRIDQAVALGARWIQTSGVFGYRRFPDEPLPPDIVAEQHATFVADMRQIAPQAEAAGVTIALKPHGGNTRTADVLRATLDEIGSPALQACYDPGNVHFYEGVDPADDVEAIAGAVRTVVAKDHRGPRAAADFPVPGEGDVDFPRILRTLASHGFDGPISVERVDGRGEPLGPADLDARLVQARRCLRDVCREAGLSVG
jgi:sugar phosphate isomerase/epimerase